VTPPLAHVAGVPLEETVLALLPAACALAVMIRVVLAERIEWLRRR
jgi:hypothetical protein